MIIGEEGNSRTMGVRPSVGCILSWWRDSWLGQASSKGTRFEREVREPQERRAVAGDGQMEGSWAVDAAGCGVCRPGCCGERWWWPWAGCAPARCCCAGQEREAGRWAGCSANQQGKGGAAAWVATGRSSGQIRGRLSQWRRAHGEVQGECAEMG